MESYSSSIHVMRFEFRRYTDDSGGGCVGRSAQALDPVTTMFNTIN